MKKILVLTDFTPNAAHSAAVALRLSEKMGMGIKLYHTLSFIPLIPGDGSGPYTTEAAAAFFDEAREQLTAEAERLREIAVMTTGNGAFIEEDNGEGTLGEVIGHLSEDEEIAMIIMGGRSGGTISHLLNGSDTLAVIRKASKPVLIIPIDSQWVIPKKVVFATDFGIADIHAMDFLLHLSELLGCGLEVVHIIKPGEVVTDIGPEVAFRKYLEKRQLSYTRVFDDEVHPGLQHYCAENAVDVLAMTHGHHSFISRLFGKSKSQAAISDKHTPVLVFPPDCK